MLYIICSVINRIKDAGRYLWRVIFYFDKSFLETSYQIIAQIWSGCYIYLLIFVPGELCEGWELFPAEKNSWIHRMVWVEGILKIIFKGKDTFH